MPTFCSPEDYIAARRLNVKESKRLEFTEGWIRGLAAAPQGKRDTYTDTKAPGFRLRVNDQGEKVFSIQHRVTGDTTGVPCTYSAS